MNGSSSSMRDIMTMIENIGNNYDDPDLNDLNIDEELFEANGGIDSNDLNELNELISKYKLDSINSDDIKKALQDAYKMGCDSVK